MLPLATFPILLGLLYVAGGAETPFELLPFVEEEGIEGPFPGGERSNIPDGNPGFDVDFSEDFDDAEGEVSAQSEASRTPAELSLAEWSRVVCTSRPALVEYFIADCVKRVKSCEKLRAAFDLRHFTARTVSAIKHDIAYQAFKKVDCPDARLSAQVVSQSLEDTFDKMTEDSFIYIYVNSIANSLFFRGVIKPNNVAALSNKFFQVFKKKVDGLKHPKQEAVLRALGAGYVEYMTSLGQFTAYTAPMITLAFAKECYALCSKYCH